MSSEIQEIIHRTTKIAFEQGVQSERERLVRVVNEVAVFEEPEQKQYFIALLTGKAEQ